MCARVFNFYTRYNMCAQLRTRTRDRSLARPKEVSNHNRDPVGYSTRPKLGQDVSCERPGAASPNPTPTRRSPRTRRGPCRFRVNAHGPRAVRVRTHRHAVLGHEFIGTAAEARSRLMALWCIISRQGVFQYEMCSYECVYNERNTHTYCILYILCVKCINV